MPLPSPSTSPTLWRVVEQCLGAVDAVVVGDQPTDGYRIGLTIVDNGDEGPDVDAMVIYPCGVCGWDNACGANGEDCHS